eukprot:CAMPEP_0194266316 /NCGR_PEP_ID=MMETSP0169-20130528/1259_1 /TAXON_ID=218684 /ORGANISM="Corethron pennatum, Strain L29A3" /LENGTH=277 /DNA_ID=CAMNT_0039006969 /DNA_START=147 /DNA_END=980 /DNA_ORIENTATION=+
MKRSSDTANNLTYENISSHEEITAPDHSGERTTLEELFRNAESNETDTKQSDSLGDELDTEEKSRRLAKNREHARSCRARKKVMIQSLRDDIRSLSEENQALKTQNETFQSRIQALQEALVDHIRILNATQATTPLSRIAQTASNDPLHAQLRTPEVTSSTYNPIASNSTSLFQPTAPSISSLNTQAYLAALNRNLSTLPQPNISSILSQNPGNYENLLSSLSQTTASNGVLNGHSHGQNNSSILSSLETEPQQGQTNSVSSILHSHLLNSQSGGRK